MIVREVMSLEFELTIESFDFFNDYPDTKCWLLGKIQEGDQRASEVLEKLEKLNLEWVESNRNKNEIS